MIVTIILTVFFLFLVFASLVFVEQQSVKVIERFGKFIKFAGPGINFVVPVIDWVAGEISLRIRQIDVDVETKTKDNVFVKLIVSVQYVVSQEGLYDSFYKLEDSTHQIKAYIYDVVRASVPKIKLDEVFEKKDDIAQDVKKELSQEMDDFGYKIVKALVTDIDPDSKVKESMNEINAAQRLRVAANEKGEAEKILKVKQAEADAQSKKLQGQGIADQRKAIIDGLKESVEEFQKGIPGATSNDVMNLVLMTQYFDTIGDLGNKSQMNTILIPHSPGGLSDIAAQIRNAVIVGEKVK